MHVSNWFRNRQTCSPYLISVVGICIIEFCVGDAYSSFSRITFVDSLGSLSESRSCWSVMLATLLGFASASVMYLFVPHLGYGFNKNE